MSDNLKSTMLTIAKLHQEVAAINHMTKQPYQRMREQMERAMKSLRCQHLEISQIPEMQQAKQMEHITNAFQDWHVLLKQNPARDKIVESLTTAHQSWLGNIKFIQDNFSRSLQIQTRVGLALCDATQQLVATERLMPIIDFEAISRRFHIEMPVISGFENALANVMASYGDFTESMRDISDIARLPNFILPGAAREIYTTSYALKALCHQDVQDKEKAETESLLVAGLETQTSCCKALLEQVNLKLAQLYIGACDALNGNNPDRARHIIISLRELCSNLLWQLAPNDRVIAWVSEAANRKNLLHNGKPTRQARILYVCRELNKDALEEFIEADTQAVVKLFDLFNKNVHKLNIELNDKELRAVLFRIDSWLMYILQITLQGSDG